MTRAKGLELGADDGVSRGNGLTVDFAARNVFVNGKEAPVSSMEWRLLASLCRNACRVLPLKSIATNVGGLNFVESSTIKMCVRRVRLKIGDDAKSP